MNYKIILIVIFCSVLGAFGQIFFSKASQNLSLNFIELYRNYNFFIGLVLYGLSTIIYVYVLKYGEVTTLYPIISLSYIWVMLLGHLMLSESLNAYKIIGSLGIVFSVGIIIRG